MQDAYDYCADLVRQADRDRFIAALFAPMEHRGALHALYAFASEVARVRELAREPAPGEIRLQWWCDVIGGARSEEAAANPVAAALLATIERYDLRADTLFDLLEARRFDLYNDAMASLADLAEQARKTSSALFALAATILAGTDAAPVAEPAGVAYAVAGLLRALPRHIARGQIYVPADLLERHQVSPNDLLAGRYSPGLVAALGELRTFARGQLAAAHARVTTLPHLALPALLPVATVGPTLDRLERSDPFVPREIPAWRRQWLIWRAARNPARIAG